MGVFLVCLALFLFALRAPAPLVFRPGMGWAYESPSGKEADGMALLAGKKGAWVNISEGLLADFARRDIKPVIKFAYDSTNGAGVCGILADRSLPSPLIIIEGQGIWQPAAAASAPFQRVDGGTYDAFWETAGPDIDPAGRGLCLFSIQGRKTSTTCALTRDGGKTWRALTTDSAAFGYNMGAVDWSASGEMTMIAQKHHSGDLVLSRDSGQTWTPLGKGGSCQALGVIGPDVLLKGMSGSGEMQRAVPQHRWRIKLDQGGRLLISLPSRPCRRVQRHGLSDHAQGDFNESGQGRTLGLDRRGLCGAFGAGHVRRGREAYRGVWEGRFFREQGRRQDVESGGAFWRGSQYEERAV